MFYSTQILAKKGPLGLVWIAAHLDRQLKRQQINDASVSASVDTLLHPEAPLALRLSGQLLLGVVRIYARKVRYLQEDATEALAHIRMALKAASAGAAVDLPAGVASAPLDAITLPGGLLEEGLLLDAGAWDLEDWGPGAGAAVAGVGGLGMGLAPPGRGVLQFQISAPSGSGRRMSTDVSEVFGMGFSGSQLLGDGDECFEEAMEGLQPFDLDDLEVERLREAPGSQAGTPGARAGGLLGRLTPGSAAAGADEEGMDVEGGDDGDLAAEQLPALSGGALASSGSAGGGVGDGGDWTPGSLGGAALGDLMPSPQADAALQVAAEEVADADVAAAAGPDQNQDGGGALGAGRRKRRAAVAGLQLPRRKLVVDKGGASGFAAATLPGGEVRALLADRAPLLDKQRVDRARAKRARVADRAAAPMAAAAAAQPGLSSLLQPAAATLAGGLALPAALQQLFPEPMMGAPEADYFEGSGGADQGLAAGAQQEGPDGQDLEGPEADWGVAEDLDAGGEGGQLLGGFTPMAGTEDGLAADDFGSAGALSSGGMPSVSAGGYGGPLGSASQGDGSGGRVAAAWPDDAEALVEEAGGEAGLPGLRHGGGVTSRTRFVMRQLVAASTAAAGDGAAAPAATPLAAGGKRRRVAAAPAAGSCEAAAAVSLEAMVAGKDRLSACRYFYEALVLTNRSLVQLAQPQAYGDIAVTPCPQAMATV